MGAYQDKMDAIAEAQAMANTQTAPYAWNAPPENMSWADLSIIESNEGTIESGVGGSVSQPYNPNEVGMGAYGRNEAESSAEIDKQQGNIINAYWNAFVSGVTHALPGVGGALAAQKAAGIIPTYPFRIEDRNLVPRFNSGNTGIAPLANNERSAASEVDKQGGYDWSLLLPANWMQTVREYLAAQEAAKEGGGIPVTMAEDIKGAGANVGETAKDSAKGGKKIIDLLGGDPAPDTPFDIINFLTNNPMIALGVGGLILLVLIIK